MKMSVRSRLSQSKTHFYGTGVTPIQEEPNQDSKGKKTAARIQDILEAKGAPNARTVTSATEFVEQDKASMYAILQYARSQGVVK